VFKRELQRLYAGGVRRAGGPINLIDIELPKLDALIEVNSAAAEHVKETAARVVDALLEHSFVIENDDDVPYSVGPMAVDPGSAASFQNALHSRYSGLNKFELAIAKAIDRTQRVWCGIRKTPATSFHSWIGVRPPRSYPDFLVWVERSVVAIDTKSDHLLNEDVRRKLFDIQSTGGRARLVLRIISEGRWSVAPTGQLWKKGTEASAVSAYAVPGCARTADVPGESPA
jgi:type III restriction enzyme